jgi:hypothetical protein
MLCKLTRSYVCHATFRRKFLVSPPLPSPLPLATSLAFFVPRDNGIAATAKQGRPLPSPTPTPPHHTSLHNQSTTAPGQNAEWPRSAGSDERAAVWSSTGRRATTVPQSVSAPSEEHRFRFRLAVTPTCDSLSRGFALAPGRVREHPSDW